MKLRYAVLIGIGILFSFGVYYNTASNYYSAVQLHVVTKCIGNNTQSTECYGRVSPPGIIVQDAHLEQSPKLVEALVKSPLAHPDADGNRLYTVNMTSSEFDSMNQMLVSAGPEAAKSYSSYPDWWKVNPTDALWSRDTTLIHIDYNGNAYVLGASYFGPKPLTPWVWDWYP
jgi:hypothetical protein